MVKTVGSSQRDGGDPGEEVAISRATTVLFGKAISHGIKELRKRDEPGERWICGKDGE